MSGVENEGSDRVVIGGIEAHGIKMEASDKSGKVVTKSARSKWNAATETSWVGSKAAGLVVSKLVEWRLKVVVRPQSMVKGLMELKTTESKIKALSLQSAA
jgi:hypothetical protein